MLTNKKQPTNYKYLHICTIKKIKQMLKFKYRTTGNPNPYALHSEQVHSKFSLCFNSSLNSIEFIPYF